MQAARGGSGGGGVDGDDDVRSVKVGGSGTGVENLGVQGFSYHMRMWDAAAFWADWSYAVDLGWSSSSATLGSGAACVVGVKET